MIQTDRAQSVMHRPGNVSSENIPSDIPTPSSSFETISPASAILALSHSNNDKMPHGQPVEDMMTPSAAPSPAVDTPRNDDDLTAGLPSGESDIDTSKSMHYSLPTGTRDCFSIAIIVIIES